MVCRKRNERAGFSPKPVSRVPESWQTKRVTPIPMVAMKIALCFAAASIRAVKTSIAVRKA
jgi:hypothetical protein